MVFDDVKFMDGWTGGKYSLVINQNKLLTERNAALENENAALEKEIAALKTAAILDLSAINRSPEEISRAMKVEKSEVLRILEKHVNGR